MGQILRTNYRRTGGAPGITALGGAVPNSSYMGGAGTNVPYGGFMIYSFIGTFQGDLSNLGPAPSGPAGCSNAWVDSTHAAMSCFYGDGMFGDGYAFLPIELNVISYSDKGIGVGGLTNAGLVQILNVHNSGSLFVVSAFKITASSMDTTYVSQASFKALVWGFIVSAP